MQFRTEIEAIRPLAPVEHGERILSLGSCFAQAIGERMARDGFDITVNPLGPLYNPASLARILARARDHYIYTPSDLTENGGTYHALDFAWRYNDTDPAALTARVNNDFKPLHVRPDLLIVTFGTAYVFEHEGVVAGNCHKLPASYFNRRLMDVDEITGIWQNLVASSSIPHIILTVSPVRHKADGLHGNMLSKARLLLAAERLVELFPDRLEYFPAYEILNDDLRDYRFYADDLCHPSSMAEDYVYDIFSKTYFSPRTADVAARARKEWTRKQHRPISGQ